MESTLNCVYWIASAPRYIGGVIYYNIPNQSMGKVWGTTKNGSLEVVNYSMQLCNIIFRPSWGITVVGFLPFVGNVANFGCAIHSYRNGLTWQGHHKLAESIIGTSLDVITVGSTTGGVKLAQIGLCNLNVGMFTLGSHRIIGDLFQRTASRIIAFQTINTIMGPFYQKS